MMARLRSSAGRNFALDDFNLIGRSEQASVRLDDHGVSRQHATIRREGGRYWVADLGSSNGTYVNDLPVAQPQPLAEGDRLQFGTAQFIFCGTGSGTPAATEGTRTLILPREIAAIRTIPVSLMVADLKGFTAMSAVLGAGEVAEILSEWYRRCRLALARHGALIDKFIGDCVFAYWLSVDLRTRLRVLEAARAILDSTRLDGPAARLLADRHGITIECGIGLHIGEAAMSSLGSGTTTALGDAVNLAFRIESLTRTLGRKVLASAAFLGPDPEVSAHFEACGEHSVKGHPVKLDIFALVDQPEPDHATSK